MEQPRENRRLIVLSVIHEVLVDNDWFSDDNEERVLVVRRLRMPDSS